MAITDWPAAERPREKLLQHGVDTRSDAELLAIFLRVGVAGKSAVDLARELLKQLQPDRHFYSDIGGIESHQRHRRQQVCAAYGDI